MSKGAKLFLGGVVLAILLRLTFVYAAKWGGEQGATGQYFHDKLEAAKQYQTIYPPDDFDRKIDRLAREALVP